MRRGAMNARPTAAVAVTIGLGLWLATPAHAADNALAEKVCVACHGAGGKSANATFPRLAGQRAEYLEVQIKAFRDRSRANPHAQAYMWGMAAQLSDDAITGVAAYYASQTPVPGTPADPAEVAKGKAIFTAGIET